MADVRTYIRIREVPDRKKHYLLNYLVRLFWIRNRWNKDSSPDIHVLTLRSADEMKMTIWQVPTEQKALFNNRSESSTTADPESHWSLS